MMKLNPVAMGNALGGATAILFALGWVGMSIFLWIFGWLLGTIYNATTRNRGQQ